MDNKDIIRHLAELNNLIHREIAKTKACTTTDNEQNINAVSHVGKCIIAYLRDHNHIDIFQKDLEEEFQVRRSTMSKALTLLENRGYISREAVSNDRRLKKIVLTDKAESVATNINMYRKNLEEKMVENISAEELTSFKITLEKIKHNLKQEGNK